MFYSFFHWCSSVVSEAFRHNNWRSAISIQILRYLLQFNHSCPLYFLYIIITFWVTAEAEVNLWPFKPGTVEIASQSTVETASHHGNLVVIGNSIAPGLRRYLTVWRTFFHYIKLLTWELEEIELKMFYGALTIQYYQSLSDQSLYTAKQIILTPAIQMKQLWVLLPLLDPSPIVIQTSKLLLVDYHRHPNIEVIVSGLLPSDIHWSTRRVKLKNTNAYLNDYCDILTKIGLCQATL